METKKLSLIHNYLPTRTPVQGDKKSPILFLLHGYGADENDLFSLAGELPGDFHVIAPRALRPLPWGGFAWYDIDFDGGKKFTDTAQALTAVDALERFIPQAVEAYGADPDNIWVLGFSQGAILSYALISRGGQAKYYMPLSGYIEQDIMRQGLSSNALNGVHVMAGHGNEDPVIPVEWGRDVQGFLSGHGADYVYREYGMGHGICMEELTDLRLWIDAHLRQPAR